jgi:hypothetical protein
LSGCEQFEVATARAGALLAALEWPPDLVLWELESAQSALAVLLHAAALGGVGMPQVRTWMNDPDAAEAQVQRFLDRSPEPVDKFIARNHLLSTAFAPTRMAVQCHDPLRARRLLVNLPVSGPRDLTDKFMAKVNWGSTGRLAGFIRVVLGARKGITPLCAQHYIEGVRQEFLALLTVVAPTDEEPG